nr:dethiobiotin synthase [Motiliproteus sp. SC1-56]
MRFFVAGTDTGVGKTHVTAALLEASARGGYRCAGLKPVAAGAESTAEGLRNEDALLLQRHASYPLAYEQINPVLLEEAIAPHIAAERAGKRLSAERLVGYCRGVMMQPLDLLLVEGAGGWRVPLNSVETLAELPKRLQLPCILVVGMRLGCINHALLSVEAIRADGVPLAGWIANRVDPGMDCYQENRDTLTRMLGAPPLAELPFSPQGDIVATAQHLEPMVSRLLAKK